MKKDYDSTRIYRNTQKKGASQTYDTPSSVSLLFLLGVRYPGKRVSIISIALSRYFISRI